MYIYINSNVISKLLVAPCFLPNFFAGDYWVKIDAGPSSDNYEYAIISGGQPTVQLKDGCTTSTNGTNGSGFGFFRQQNVNNTLINFMNNLAREKGFSLMLMNKVTQKGCVY